MKMVTAAPAPVDYESIFSATQSAYLILDTELVIVEVNHAYLQATDRTRESVLGRYIFDAFPDNPADPHADGVPRLHESLRRVLQLQTADQVGVLQYDIPIGPPERGSFEKRYWSPINSPVFDGQGKLTHIIHQAIDVTSRVTAEIALRASEFRFRALATATGDVIYRMSPDWVHMHELDGRGFLKDAESQGQWRIEDYVPTEDVAMVQGKIDDAIREKSTYDLEHRVLRTDGSRGWTHSRAVPILDAQGHITEWIGSASDISARMLGEEQLRDANQRKDEFLAMLAHELRNPLAPIAAAADLLRLAAHDDGRVRKAGEIVGRQVKHLTGLVDDMLDVSRVTRGHVVLECVPVDMRSIVQNAIEQVRPLVEGRRHRLLLQTPPYAAMVHGDAKRLTQVVTNLLANAIKYTPEQGEISAYLEQDETNVQLIVSDNGIGMSRELVAHCFELFVQGERSSERAAGGLGIGLALVKSLVELHDGRVDVRSDVEGQGSTFTVTLPKLSTSDLGSTAPFTVVSAVNPLRVFVVDDNTDAAEMLTMLIDQLGYQTLVETQPRRALERITEERPHVCLMDIGMPEMDGYALARVIRAQMEAAAPVLVAISGYSQPQDRSSALEAGFTEHFAKPVDSRQLADFLSRISPQTSQSGT